MTLYLLQCSCSFLCKWKLLASHTMIFKHWSFHIFFFYSESLDVKEGNKIRHPLSQILAVITDSHRPTFRLYNKAFLLSNSILAASPFRANAQKISIDQKGKISLFRRPTTWGEGEFVSKNQFQRFCLTMKAFKGKFSSVAQLCPTLCDPMDCSIACQASLPITNSQSLFKLKSIKSVMPSNHLVLCRPLLPPSIFPSIRVFSSESILPIRWPNYWSFSFSISSSNEYSGLISFKIDWFDLLAV